MEIKLVEGTNADIGESSPTPVDGKKVAKEGDIPGIRIKRMISTGILNGEAMVGEITTGLVLLICVIVLHQRSCYI